MKIYDYNDDIILDDEKMITKYLEEYERRKANEIKTSIEMLITKVFDICRTKEEIIDAQTSLGMFIRKTSEAKAEELTFKKIKIIIQYADNSQEILYVKDKNVGEAMRKANEKYKDKGIYKIIGEEVQNE